MTSYSLQGALDKLRVRKWLANADVYRAVDGEYTKGRQIHKENLALSPYHEKKLSPNGNKLDVVLDKDAPDYDDMFISKGSSIPPDELLEILKPGHLKIPIKHRDEFAEDRQLPSSELLKVIHYFASKKFTSTKKGEVEMARTMDESALLALGILVESWVDRMVDENTVKMFVDHCDSDSDSLDLEGSLLGGESSEEDEIEDQEDSSQNSDSSSEAASSPSSSPSESDSVDSDSDSNSGSDSSNGSSDSE
ncbi:hypothetical protein G9P44_006044 [Scheffersomyces stipitis]|nr:hypothetical protein G9P44_006044 [Scheffersomyces stipitis]